MKLFALAGLGIFAIIINLAVVGAVIAGGIWLAVTVLRALGVSI